MLARTHSGVFILGLAFNTRDITSSLPQDKILMINTQAAKVASSPTIRGVIRLLGLKNLPAGHYHGKAVLSSPAVLATSNLHYSRWSIEQREPNPEATHHYFGGASSYYNQGPYTGPWWKKESQWMPPWKFTGATWKSCLSEANGPGGRAGTHTSTFCN